MSDSKRNVHHSLVEYERKINELLDIDETSPSGLRWNKSAAPNVRGRPAGRMGSHGYWKISLRAHGKQREFGAHRIVWLLINGQWPKEQIDHINNDRADNRFANLREASVSENMRNMGMSIRNTSSVKGVSFHKGTGKWRARVELNRKEISLGYFDSIDDAEQAAMAARDRLHGEFANHGVH